MSDKPKRTDIKARVEAKNAEERKQFAPETESPKPLFQWRGIDRFLDKEPRPIDWIFDGLLEKKIVGAIFATGGVGKTFLAIQFCSCLAAGVPFGPFRPVKPMKVLFIGGEDSEEIFHRRLYRTVPAMGLKNDTVTLQERHLRENLAIESLVGKDRFLTELDESGNPRTTNIYQQLQETIKAIGDLDLLVIDPKSRFDGLNENDNSHATFFVSKLEKLVTDHGITVLFSHHESKAQVKDGEVKSSSGRGASALRDGVRWAISLGELGDKEAEKFGVKAAEHIEVITTKTNNAKKWDQPKYFRRGDHGVLSPIDLYGERIDGMVEILIGELANSNHHFTERELVNVCENTDRKPVAKKIITLLDESTAGFKKMTDVKTAIDRAVFRGKLIESDIQAGQKTKKVLIVPDEIRAKYARAPEEPPKDDPAEEKIKQPAIPEIEESKPAKKKMNRGTVANREKNTHGSKVR